MNPIDSPNAFTYDLIKEYQRAREKFPRFHSAHEGHAVLREEVEELWEMVKKGKGLKIKNPMAKDECIQIAAMAMAFYLECCE